MNLGCGGVSGWGGGRRSVYVRVALLVVEFLGALRVLYDGVLTS